MKTPLVLSLLFGMTLFSSMLSFGKVFHWPEVCETGTLVINNQSTQELRFFLQTFNPTLVSEDALTVAPHSILNTEVSGYSKSEWQKRLSLLSLNPTNASFQVNMKCHAETYQASYRQSGEWTFKKDSQLKTHKLWIKNLSPNVGTYELTVFNGTTSKSRTIDLQPFEQKSVMVKDAEMWPFFKFKTSTKAAVFYLNHSQNIEPIAFNSVGFQDVDQSGVYFEVQNREQNEDSFVIHITDAEMISRARAILASPNSEKIVIGEVKKGSGNHNRNLFSADHAPWSWHVSRVTNFSDFASTACNGIPQIVEDRALTWPSDPGRICFWTYRLKREISSTDL